MGAHPLRGLPSPPDYNSPRQPEQRRRQPDLSSTHVSSYPVPDMEIIPEVKACESCAKSKRKCGKESPRCHRCASRGLECVYPLPTRPSAFVRLQDPPASAATTPAPAPVTMPMSAAKDIGRPLDMWDPSVLLSFAPTSSSLFDGINDAPTNTGMDLELGPPSALLPYAPAKQLSPGWFMSPDSWKVEHDLPHYRDPMPASPYSRIALKAFLTTGQGWLSDWISTGGTAYIHKQLYSFRLPRSVQDAYTSVALYLLRTDENEDMVHRTIQDRSAQLLQDEERHTTSSSLDPFSHLARVHALLTYQIICLLDGDIRLRGLAEERIPTMMAWLKQMLESVSFASQLTPSGSSGAMAAARGLGLGIVDVMDAATSSTWATPPGPGGAFTASTTPAATTTSTPSSTTTSSAGNGARTFPFNPSSQEEVLWHAWVFTESVRRTWVFAQGLHTVYDVMLKGWTICAGALRMTTASGAWDAPTSYAWAKLCVERDVRLNTPIEVENFLTEARPEDVDDFAKSLLGVMFGKAKMDRWMDAKA